MLELVTPTMEYKEKAIDFINEFNEYKSDINGTGGLYRYLNDYEGWLKKLEEDKNRPVTEEKVPAETFFLVRKEDDKINILKEYADRNNLYISGGSDYHGSPKPDIEIGSGRGSLQIPKKIINEWHKG